MGDYSGVTIALLVGQSAWLVLYLASVFPILSTAPCLLGYASYISLLFLFTKILPPKKKNENPEKCKRGGLYYVCCLFTWCTVTDLIFYLEVIGMVDGFIGFYLKNGEPYLDSSFGTVALLWDPLGNLIVYLIIIYRIDNNLDCRNAVLYFSGTLITSLFCLLVGGVSGTHGKQLYPSTWLNVPYVVAPIYYLLEFVSKPRQFSKETITKVSTEYKISDILLSLGLFATFVFGIIRGLSAFGSPMYLANVYSKDFEPYLMDPSKFGAVWVIYFMIIGSILQISIVFGLFNPGSSWVLDLSIIYAAITIHGTFIHLIPQFCEGVLPKYHIPPGAQWLVVLGNLFIPIVAVSVVIRCFKEQSYFKSPDHKQE
uniref:Transmembrane 6 superfamily member 1-like n=1 Tax=Ciona intestinalis TaxID=7719 RepID=F6WGT4_CIOIN|nr:transmembrane 6 superfamily member 1-like [Ciona intestinalis]|eukprot:XP_004227050.3 transmembrane 6 superfamily member 1-like [Ciona intestinalis]